MPLYEYACRRCEHRFTGLVFDGDTVQCPQCQGSDLERLLSVPARPRSGASSLPTACNSDGPPCGAPWCQRK